MCRRFDFVLSVSVFWASRPGTPRVRRAYFPNLANQRLTEHFNVNPCDICDLGIHFCWQGHLKFSNTQQQDACGHWAGHVGDFRISRNRGTLSDRGRNSQAVLSVFLYLNPIFLRVLSYSLNCFWGSGMYVGGMSRNSRFRFRL